MDGILRVNKVYSTFLFFRTALKLSLIKQLHPLTADNYMMQMLKISVCCVVWILKGDRYRFKISFKNF